MAYILDTKKTREKRRFAFATVILAIALAISAAMFVGCTAEKTSTSSASSSDPIKVVWLPDNSSSDMTASRDAIGAAIKEATGRDAEMITTTDYNVAIESIASGQAQMGFLGCESYVQANKKNPHVLVGFTHSDEDGGLDGACYYSRIAVRDEDASQYKDGDSYSIENIEGKNFSFVSATSTSGFKVPSSAIVEKFDLESNEQLLQNDAFFSEVLFGNSHQGSAVNLLSGDADVAAFDDEDVDMYLDLVSGEPNAVGSVYRVKEDAEAPFDKVRGEEFTIIQATPVLNSPVCFNQDAISDEDRQKIIEYFCSPAVANDTMIFVDPNDENAKGLYEKKSDKVTFVEVDDSWYEPIRKLGGGQ